MPHYPLYVVHPSMKTSQTLPSLSSSSLSLSGNGNRSDENEGASAVYLTNESFLGSHFLEISFNGRRMGRRDVFKRFGSGVARDVFGIEIDANGRDVKHSVHETAFDAYRSSLYDTFRDAMKGNDGFVEEDVLKVMVRTWEDIGDEGRVEWEKEVCERREAWHERVRAVFKVSDLFALLAFALLLSVGQSQHEHQHTQQTLTHHHQHKPLAETSRVKFFDALRDVAGRVPPSPPDVLVFTLLPLELRIGHVGDESGGWQGLSR